MGCMGDMGNEQALALLEELDQKEILEKYQTVSEKEKKEFIEQFKYLEKTCPGGIKDYIKRAKVFLEDSKNNVNPFKDYTPQVPKGFNVKVGNNDFYELEKLGFEVLKDTCFCLVAGGLGERLKYPDIKIGIQTDLVTLRTFIQFYIDYLKAFEDRVIKKFKPGNNWFIPLAIMTSDDTNDKTVALLKENKNYGLKEGQIVIIKQEKCPAIADNDCHLALKKDKFLIETKPHGHGDVHNLLWKNNLIKKWIDQGKKYLVLFQDTNILIFNSILSALGSSVKLGLAINSICVPRKPGDQIGAICKLIKSDGSSITNNVEYNQLDSLLKEKYNSKGDVPNKDGLSDFPGNINVLIFEMKQYGKALDKTKGIVPEFVNPKYTDETRTKFKSPTRLESLMQDLPKLLTDGEEIGFTVYDRWFCFSACKNDIVTACIKYKSGANPESAFSIEQDFFFCTKNILNILQKLEIKETEPQNQVVVNDVTFKFGPKIIIYPSFAISVSELKEKLEKMNGKICVTNNSTLILKNDIIIEKGIELDGNLTIEKEQKDNVVCNNKQRWEYFALKEGEGKIYEKIRGYSNRLVEKK